MKILVLPQDDKSRSKPLYSLLVGLGCTQVYTCLFLSTPFSTWNLFDVQRLLTEWHMAPWDWMSFQGWTSLDLATQPLTSSQKNGGWTVEALFWCSMWRANIVKIGSPTWTDWGYPKSCATRNDKNGWENERGTRIQIAKVVWDIRQISLMNSRKKWPNRLPLCNEDGPGGVNWGPTLFLQLNLQIWNVP